MHLNTEVIAGIPIPLELKEYCTLLPGLFLQVHPTGKKCFRVRVELDDTDIDRTIGYFPSMSVDDAYVTMTNLLLRRSPTNFALPETGALMDALSDYADNKSLTNMAGTCLLYTSPSPRDS